jgi:methyl-accepting chemotaxis protein
LTRYLEKYIKKLAGKRDIQDSLDRLDKLTQEEARMASAELLKMTRSVDDRVRGVEQGVQDVRGDMQDVGNNVKGIDDGVQGIGSDVKDISSDVRGVDHKLDQINRSWSL